MIETNPINRTKLPNLPPAVATQDITRPDPLDGRTLYVLGFGVAGAILANTILLIYFASLYASG